MTTHNPYGERTPEMGMETSSEELHLVDGVYVDEVGIIHDAPPADAWHGMSGRVASLQAQIDALTAALGDLAAGGGEDKRPTTLRIYDPQIQPHRAQRLQAWRRRYAFVEDLNSMWGAQRDPQTGAAYWYIRAGWWENPLAVSYLAALEGCWTEAFLKTKRPADGNFEMYSAVCERTEETLIRVCGNNPTNHDWAQNTNHPTTWLPHRPPTNTQEETEENRLRLFEEYINTYQPLPARTGFFAQALADATGEGENLNVG